MVARTLLPLLLLSTLLGSASAGPAERSVWGSYVELYDSLLAMQPDPTRCSRISGVQIHRDAGVFTLTNGVLALCTPVGGRTIAAVFNGRLAAGHRSRDTSELEWSFVRYVAAFPVCTFPRV